MNTATAKPLLDLCAKDMMSRDLTLVPEEMSLQAAAHLLSQARISGAPVVDAKGRCVGVLSTTDLVHWIDERKPVTAKSLGSSGCVCEWQVIDVANLPIDPVRTHMTADPVTASPHTLIGELARTMIDAHIHRVIVLDGERRPMGIVSSTDILAAVAYAEKS